MGAVTEIEVHEYPCQAGCELSAHHRSPQTYIRGTKIRGYLLREVTSLKYTRFERARIIGARALQISLGAPVLVDVSEATFDPIEIAIMEYDKGVVPMTVKRE
jgi:DNA-directed RNA polymerase subunit K